jgi:hypothetical protein
MNRLEKLIIEIRKQLIPYRHEHDVERGCERWEVGDADLLSSWVAAQLAVCRRKSKCEKKGMCVFYSYSDLARKNYEICREMILLLENGDVQCSCTDKSEEK